MAFIRYEDPFSVSIGEDTLTFFNYGNYGGPGYPDEDLLLTRPNGDPLSYRQLVRRGDDSQDPVDIIDYFFYVHDVESMNAGEGYTNAHAAADINLIRSLTTTDTSYDPEASLYDGLATLAMIGRLVIHGDIGLISPGLLVTALADAVNDIEYGIENFHKVADPAEVAAVFGVLFGEPAGPDLYELQFTFPDIPGASEFEQEVVEFAAINTLAAAINEPGDIAWSPFGDEYVLRFDKATSDLDLISV